VWAGLVRLDTRRCRWKGRGTMDEIVFSLKPHGRFLRSEPVEFHALSGDLTLEAA